MLSTSSSKSKSTRRQSPLGLLPQQVSLPVAHSAFGGDGRLLDEKKQQAVERLAAQLVDMTGKLAAVPV